MSKAWARGSTTRWRRIRAFVLARDGYRCRAHDDGWCAQVPGQHQCAGTAPLIGGHAHHTRGRAVTGDNPAFIVAACAECNRHIGSPERHSPQPRRVTRW